MYNDMQNISLEHKEKMRSKISSYTQVEPEFVGRDPDIRSIIGQEDIAENLSNRLIGLDLRKESKGIRPPLVGQASSSSNDSVSVTFETKTTDSENRYTGENSPTSHGKKIDTSLNPNIEIGQSNVNFTRGIYVSTPFMFTRDDFLNQRPPEGSSDQLRAVVQPSDILDFPSVRSPSSVSSVTSGRPLEWDSGADVGYNQVCNFGKNNDPGMSTIERMALACGTNLLTRSDPEGTTGPSGQPQAIAYIGIPAQTRSRSSNKLGFPNAESTPVGTFVTSNLNPDNDSEGIISPIAYEDTHEVLKKNDINLSVCEGDQLENKAVLSGISQKSIKSKVPLFPEIVSSRQDIKEQTELGYQSSCKTREEDFDEKNTAPEIESGTVWLKLRNLNFESFNSPRRKNTISENENKKLSSSLENISLVKSTSEGKIHSKTLPRSQSQVALYTDTLVYKNVEGGNSNNFPKYNMALHSLIQYNKSASSSSISTVVHKKGDSPKHMFVQTSVLKQESVAVQVSELNNATRHAAFNAIEDDTPHLPKFAVADQFHKKSNYFQFDSKNEEQDSLSKKIGKGCQINNDSTVHSHNGIPCTGAHRKVPCLEKFNSKPSDKVTCNSRDNICNIHSNICIDENQSPLQNSQKTGKVKSAYCDITVDSIESSTKSGGCWTDKQSSVTVEDRVNSFEYLPGPVYENNERQQIIDSRGTSSASIHNQFSKNERLNEQWETWDSSASTPNSLEKDVQRAVEIISNFVKGSCANNSTLKKKLIRQVVEKLISKNYAIDQLDPVELQNNLPWVPSKPPNLIERNGRETRRSISRSKVPCEFSSRSEKSGSTNLSSECFIPRPAASSTFLPSSLRDNSCITGKKNNTSTSELTSESCQKIRTFPHAVDVNVQIHHNGSISKDFTGSSSSKISHSSDWREPTTKTEKMAEEKLKLKRTSCSSQNDAGVLAQYLNMEREIQLFSIRSEIQRLSNLKELLEKQQDLKKGIKGLKSRQHKHRSSRKSALKDRNTDQAVGGKAESRVPEEKRKVPYAKSQSEYKPTLSGWLEDIVADAKTTSTVVSPVSTDGLEDWTSHHYKNENDENLRSCMKRKSKHYMQKSNKEVSSLVNQSRAIYDEPYKGRGEEVKQSKYPTTPYRHRGKNHLEESVFITDKGAIKKSAESQTVDTVGVQTSDSMQQLPAVHLNWSRHRHKQSEHRNQEDKLKSPVGYYITFEPSPREPDEPNNLQQPLKEVRIPVPMSEPKKRPPRRLRAGLDKQEIEREEECVRPETVSSQSDIDRKPIRKVGTGELQYYLLHNRPSYVSRAEDRRQCIAQMQYLRELRDHSKRCLRSLAEPPSVPHVPAGVKRVFSQQSMRRQTERTYRQLSEVKERQHDTKRKESYRTNRLMAEVFKKKLQKRVLKGEVNLSNSVSVISSL